MFQVLSALTPLPQGPKSAALRELGVEQWGVGVKQYVGAACEPSARGCTSLSLVVCLLKHLHHRTQQACEERALKGRQGASVP